MTPEKGLNYHDIHFFERNQEMRGRTRLLKEEFKRKLFFLFSQGKTPSEIDLGLLIDLLGLDAAITTNKKIRQRRKQASLRTKVGNRLQTLFTVGIRQTLDYLYQRWKEENQSQS